MALALRLIREHACEGWSANQIIERIPVSRSVLQRRFRKETGGTLQEQLIEVRMKRARQLLTESTLPLIEVGERAGFTHQQYFCATFKARFGRTPAEFRREARFNPRFSGAVG